MNEQAKTIFINIILPIIGLILAISAFAYVDKIQTPHILEGDLVNQCREAGGDYDVLQWSSGGFRVRCEMPTEYLFNLELQ